MQIMDSSLELPDREASDMVAPLEMHPMTGSKAGAKGSLHHLPSDAHSHSHSHSVWAPSGSLGSGAPRQRRSILYYRMLVVRHLAGGSAFGV